jgi:hypothetical protein
MYVQTAEPYIEPPNDVVTEMATSKLINGKAAGHHQIPTTLTKEEEMSPSRSFMNSFKKYGRKRSYHMIGSMT